MKQEKILFDRRYLYQNIFCTETYVGFKITIFNRKFKVLLTFDILLQMK